MSTRRPERQERDGEAMRLRSKVEPDLAGLADRDRPPGAGFPSLSGAPFVKRIRRLPLGLALGAGIALGAAPLTGALGFAPSAGATAQKTITSCTENALKLAVA